MSRRIVSMTVCLIVSGCGVSWFTEPKTQPVIEHRVGSPLLGEANIGTLSTTAERRIVLAPLSGPANGYFCAEPSPDAAESLAASFTAAADASQNSAVGSEARVKAEIARSIATSVGALTRRSQGLQLFRDGIFALCQFRMNGFITDQEFSRQYFELRNASVGLINTEIQQPSWNKLPDIQVNTPPAQ